MFEDTQGGWQPKDPRQPKTMFGDIQGGGIQPKKKLKQLKQLNV